MENTILQQLGLDTEQIIVYEYLLKNGKSKAREITKNTPLKRGLVYKVLDELVTMKIVEKNDSEGAVSTFEALHPSALKTLAESKVREAQNAQNHLEHDLGTFISMYNLANNKPGIEFYEGLEGIKKIYNEILQNTSNEPVRSIVKVLDKKIDKETYSVINDYIQKRIKKNILSQSIAINNPQGVELKKGDNASFRKTKLITAKKMPMDFPGGEIIIHNQKTYFLAYENHVHIALSITNNGMYQLLFALFESMWDNLEDFK